MSSTNKGYSSNYGAFIEQIRTIAENKNSSRHPPAGRGLDTSRGFTKNAASDRTRPAGTPVGPRPGPGWEQDEDPPVINCSGEADADRGRATAHSRDTEHGSQTAGPPATGPNAPRGHAKRPEERKGAAMSQSPHETPHFGGRRSSKSGSQDKCSEEEKKGNSQDWRSQNRPKEPAGPKTELQGSRQWKTGEEARASGAPIPKPSSGGHRVVAGQEGLAAAERGEFERRLMEKDAKIGELLSYIKSIYALMSYPIQYNAMN